MRELIESRYSYTTATLCLFLETMPAAVYLITGGCRSGKSSYAQHLCESLCPNPIYLATATKWDGDFEERIQRHQNDRGDHWTTIEEPLKLSQHIESFKGRVVLVDCLTLWLTNYFVEEGAFQESRHEASASITDSLEKVPDLAFAKIKEEFEALTSQWDCTLFFVTNELGSGTHPNDRMSRKFVDVQGWLNQYVAKRADKVIHMVSGCPNVIKEETKHSRSKEVIPNAGEAMMLDKFLSKRRIKMDDKGYFMMKLDTSKGVIVTSFHSCMKNDKGEICDLKGEKISCCEGTSNTPQPMKVWECRTAKQLTTEIFEKWPYSNEIVSVGHAAYIGREAQKAEHCLYAGDHYQQD